MPSKNLVAIRDSERFERTGARRVGVPDSNDIIEVSVLVRSKNPVENTALVKEMSSKLPKERQYLSREEFAATYGADDNDLKKIETFAHENNLTVVEVSKARRTVVLSGTIAALSTAFDVHLANYEHNESIFRGRTGSIYVPEEIHDIVQGVFGLDNRQQAKHHHRQSKPKNSTAMASNDQGYYPSQIAQLYKFPRNVDGKGECIAILEFTGIPDNKSTGGYKSIGGYTKTDLNTYFNHLGIPTPKITAVSVDHVRNHPVLSDPYHYDVEVMLDIEVAGAVAPGAQIVVYFAPFTERGWVDAITKAVHDDIHKPSVISISWGFAEGKSIWTDQAIKHVNKAFKEAVVMGITICVASGDDGSRDQINDGSLHVDFPSSSPYVLACGGTKLVGTENTISSEVVWNESLFGDHQGGGATGGGISELFDLPEYQASANVPRSSNLDRHIGRGVPDVAAKADAARGYITFAYGIWLPVLIGGTSAAAPLWAGLIALLNQKLRKSVGYLNPILYDPNNSNILNNIIEGHNNVTDSNGPYKANSGWNACTGLGSPNGKRLLNALKSSK